MTENASQNGDISWGQFQEILRLRERGIELGQRSDWVSEGDAREALAKMLAVPVVTADEFHRVYARILDSECAADTDIQDLFDDLLHVSGTPYDRSLMQQGKVSTVPFGQRDQAPDDVGVLDGAAAEWAVAHISVEDRIKYLF